MKITYLHQYFNTPSMFGGTRSYEMARRLVAMGHEVNMVTSWREPDGRKQWFQTNEAGIKVHWLPVPYSNRMGFKDRILAFLKFALRSARRAASLESDIIFATSTPLTIVLPAFYAAYKSKVPMVFEIRDLWPEMPIAIGALTNPLQVKAARALELWAYRHASSVVALSPGMKSGVMRTGYPSSRVAVIPNSCDNAEFTYNQNSERQFRAARPWLGNNPLLIYAGTFGRVNGVGYAVALAKQLLVIDSTIRILLVGDGAERESVKQQAQEAGVLGINLFFEREVSKKEVIALFSASTMSSSLFVDLPEMRINSANKFFDALAAGKPIFLNYGGWMHDLVLQHQCGISAWGRPLDQVARELDCRLNDSAWLHRAGHSARMLAECCFDRDLLASQLENVFFAAVNGKFDMAESIAPGVY